jgi:uncharacterized protein
MKKQFHPVKNNAEVEKIIQGTYQGVLSMADGNIPYALPINHAYKDGRFYFHCAPTGRKLDLIRKNPDVTYVISKYYGDAAHFEADQKCHGFWESVIAYGKAYIVTGREEQLTAFKTFMAYYGTEDYQASENIFETNRAIVIEVEKMTARREYEEHRTDYWYWEKE